MEEENFAGLRRRRRARAREFNAMPLRFGARTGRASSRCGRRCGRASLPRPPPTRPPTHRCSLTTTPWSSAVGPLRVEASMGKTPAGSGPCASQRDRHQRLRRAGARQPASCARLPGSLRAKSGPRSVTRRGPRRPCRRSTTSATSPPTTTASSLPANRSGEFDPSTTRGRSGRAATRSRSCTRPTSRRTRAEEWQSTRPIDHYR